MHMDNHAKSPYSHPSSSSHLSRVSRELRNRRAQSNRYSLLDLKPIIVAFCLKVEGNPSVARVGIKVANVA